MTWADRLGILALIALLAVFFGLSDSNVGLHAFGEVAMRADTGSQRPSGRTG